MATCRIEQDYKMTLLSAQLGPTGLTEAMTWTDVIAEAKTEVELLEAQLKASTSYLRAQLSVIEAPYKAKINRLKVIEEDARDELMAYMERTHHSTVSSSRAVAEFRQREALDIAHPESIPTEYMTPDEKRITRALKAGLEVPGASMEIVNVLYVTRA